MKKIILVFILLVFTGCETTNSETSASSAGEWLMAGSSNKGKKFVIGDDKNVEIVMKCRYSNEIYESVREYGCSDYGRYCCRYSKISSW